MPVEFVAPREGVQFGWQRGKPLVPNGARGYFISLQVFSQEDEEHARSKANSP